MFDTHLSTTIWQKPRHLAKESFLTKEKRLVYVGIIDIIISPLTFANWLRKQAWEKTKMAANAGWKGVKWGANKTYGAGHWAASKGAGAVSGGASKLHLQERTVGLVRGVFSPITYLANKTREGIGKIFNLTETTGRAVGKVGGGLVDPTGNSVGRGLAEPLLGGVYAPKHIAWDTNIQLAKDLVETPKHILKTPKYFTEATSESMSIIGGDVKNIYNDVKSLSPLKATKSTFKLGADVVKSPFNIIGKTLSNPLKAPINYVKNWGTALYKLFPERIGVGISHFRGGIQRILGSWSTAKEDTASAQAMRAANQANKPAPTPTAPQQEAPEGSAQQ